MDIKMSFTKHYANPIYGNETLGTIFDAYVTKQCDGKYRMDISWRREKSTAVIFGDDGINFTQPKKLRSLPLTVIGKTT